MSDPSTLLLLTCAACTDATPNVVQQDNAVCTQTQGQTQEHQPVAGALDCISAPETVPVSLSSGTSAVEMLQAKSLNENQSASRRNSSKLFANLLTPVLSQQTVAASALGTTKIATTIGKITPKSYQQAATSPLVGFVPPTLRLFSPGPEYLWFLGWAAVYAGGLIVILKEDINSYIKGFRAFKTSDGDKDAEAFAGDYSIEYRRLSEVIATTEEAQSQKANHENASSDTVESEKIDLAEDIINQLQLPDKSDHSSRVFLKNLRTLIEVVTENGTNKINLNSSVANGSKFAYFLPLDFRTQTQNKFHNSLFHFPINQDNTFNINALFADHNGKLYVGKQELSTLLDGYNLPIPGGKLGRESSDEEEVDTISLESVDYQLQAFWAEQVSVEPHKQLFVTLTNPPSLLDYEEKEVSSNSDKNDENNSSSEKGLIEDKTEQQEVRNNVQKNSDHNSSLEKDSVKAKTEVKDDTKAGTLIATLSSGNPKVNETYTYSLVDDAGGRFILKGNELRVLNNSVLESEEEIVYTVTVRRQDSRGISVDKSFRIKSSLTAR
ncbi:MAG: hypothetical protein F6K36_25475 [Symploca sp. SIO3C6]|nr:hypothetical protein [Symploca sp. SIO3C6]